MFTSVTPALILMYKVNKDNIKQKVDMEFLQKKKRIPPHGLPKQIQCSVLKFYTAAIKHHYQHLQ